jgi:hypothetical protein
MVQIAHLLMLICVLGVIALATDLTVMLGWLRRRWRCTALGSTAFEVYCPRLREQLRSFCEHHATRSCAHPNLLT